MEDKMYPICLKMCPCSCVKVSRQTVPINTCISLFKNESMNHKIQGKKCNIVNQYKTFFRFFMYIQWTTKLTAGEKENLFMFTRFQSISKI